MNELKHALLLVGSPRGVKSTSESLGAYLLEQMKKKGVETSTVRLHHVVEPSYMRKELLDAVEKADLIVLSSPLYVDSLPSAVIKALELIAADKKVRGYYKKHKFMALVNCGFPEARQNDTALHICQRFAIETGMEWAGGMGLGMGPAIDGRPLERVGGMVRNVRKALDLTALALTEGKAVPGEAVELFGKRFVPGWLYLVFGNYGWKRMAKKNGVRGRLNDKPYEVPGT